MTTFKNPNKIESWVGSSSLRAYSSNGLTPHFQSLVILTFFVNDVLGGPYNMISNGIIIDSFLFFTETDALCCFSHFSILHQRADATYLTGFMLKTMPIFMLQRCNLLVACHESEPLANLSQFVISKYFYA